jgi:transcriptional antiterminator NusG
MRENERTALKKFLGNDFVIDISKGYKEGDFVRVTSGPLIGNESRILRLNRNRQNAVLELNLFGSTVEVSVGLELVEKV